MHEWADLPSRRQPTVKSDLTNLTLDSFRYHRSGFRPVQMVPRSLHCQRSTMLRRLEHVAFVVLANGLNPRDVPGLLHCLQNQEIAVFLSLPAPFVLASSAL